MSRSDGIIRALSILRNISRCRIPFVSIERRPSTAEARLRRAWKQPSRHSQLYHLLDSRCSQDLNSSHPLQIATRGQGTGSADQLLRLRPNARQTETREKAVYRCYAVQRVMVCGLFWILVPSILVPCTFAPAQESLTQPDIKNASAEQICLASRIAQPERLDSPEPAVRVVATQLALDRTSQRLDAPTTFDARHVACLAAQRSWTGRGLRQHGKTIWQLYCNADECEQQAAKSLKQFLVLQSRREDSRAAATAMKAYYSYVAVAEQIDILQQSQAALAIEAAKQNRLKQSGLSLDSDTTQLERQQLTLQDRLIQLQQQSVELRNAVKRTTGVELAESGRLEPLDIRHTEFSIDGLQAQAVTRRHDLRAWALLAQEVNSTSAPVFARTLSTLTGGYGLPLPPTSGLRGLLCQAEFPGLAHNLKHELQIAYRFQRESILSDVERFASRLHSAYKRIDLATQVSDSWQRRVKTLSQLAGQGQPRPIQRYEANANLLQARSAVSSRKLEARILEIDLSLAVGGLADRCCAGQAWLPLAQ